MVNLATPPNTKVVYKYSDLDMLEAYGEVVLEGHLSEADLELIASRLYQHEFFIPEQIGLAPLQSRTGRPEPDNNDIVWHQFRFDMIARTHEPATGIKALDLVENFRHATWDVGLANRRLFNIQENLPRRSSLRLM